MKILELIDTLDEFVVACEIQDVKAHLSLIQLLIETAQECTTQLRKELRENGAVSMRRKSKERETASDPKPPVKPVRVAEPSKPKKPKYSGNHAPSARR